MKGSSPPHGIIPRRPARLRYAGGPVISHIDLVSFYWGSFNSRELAAMQAWLTQLAACIGDEAPPPGTEWVLRQYGVTRARVGPFWHEPQAPIHATERDVRSTIESLQLRNFLPPFDPTRLFVVFTKGISMPGYGTTWCGYHESWGVGKYFAICPYPTSACGSGMRSWQIAASHEIMEAATDPMPGTGWVIANQEGADTCEGCITRLPRGAIQKFADNRLGICSDWTVSDPTERCWLRCLYWDLLGRPADADGWDHWLIQRALGHSPWSVASTFLRSKEYAAKCASELCTTLFGRVPENNANLAVRRRQLEAGVAIQAVVAQLCNSEAFKMKYPPPLDFLSALYAHLLGRNPNRAELVSWVHRLETGTPSAEVVLAFLCSTEYRSRAISRYYRQLLGRAPSLTELAYWINQAKQGAALQSVVARLVASSEYRRRALYRN